MCLSTEIKLTDEIRGITEGYKVFKKSNGKYSIEPEFQNFHIGSLPKRRWIKDPEDPQVLTLEYEDDFTGYRIGHDRSGDEIALPIPKRYPTGFHVFETLEGAMRWNGGNPRAVIHRVKIRNIVAAGKQVGQTCLVCQEMFIMEEVG